jgi:hypothetical protein
VLPCAPGEFKQDLLQFAQHLVTNPPKGQVGYSVADVPLRQCFLGCKGMANLGHGTSA